MSYQEFWGYDDSNREKLRAQISVDFPTQKPGFVDSYLKPSVNLASLPVTTSLIVADVCSGGRVVNAFCNMADSKDLLPSLGVGYGYAFTFLMAGQFIVAKVDQVVSAIRADANRRAQIERFIEVEYPQGSH